MSSIYPSTNVRLLTGVPLNPSYNDTIYFSSISAQTQYFYSMTKPGMIFSNQSFQRASKNKIRLQVPIEAVYDCNYMVFTNQMHGNKPFYAFITKVEYVNEKTSEITYELDVIQTWYFQFSFGECFIERTHVLDDRIGANIVEENLATGDFISRDIVESQNFSQMTPCVMTTLKKDGTDTSTSTSYSYENISPLDDTSAIIPPSPSPGDGNPGATLPPVKYVSEINRIYTGCNIYGFTSSYRLNEFFTNVIDNGTHDGVVAFYMVPTAFIGTKIDSNSVEKITGLNSGLKQTISRPTSDIDGYVPKNNKLFIYPYNFLAVVGTSGDNNILKYELFKNPSSCLFNEYCTVLPNPTAITVPFDYDNDSGGNFSYAVGTSNFPVCGYAIDSYRAWLAQNQNRHAYMKESMVFNAFGNAISSFTSGFMQGGPVGGLAGMGFSAFNSAMSAKDKIDSLIAEKKDRALLPNNATGTECSDTLSMLRANTFQYIRKTIRYEYAKSIDDYFTMFGYKVNRLGVPNDHARRAFTYIKTVGCNIIGKLPSDDVALLESIHDKGITYWRKGEYVGNYSLDNRP